MNTPLEGHHPEQTQHAVGFGVLRVVNDVMCGRDQVADRRTALQKNKSLNERCVYLVKLAVFQRMGTWKDAHFFRCLITMNLSCIECGLGLLQTAWITLRASD